MKIYTLESSMNIELDEVIAHEVTDDALELAARGAQGNDTFLRFGTLNYCC
jgi:hypothetical protein